MCLILAFFLFYTCSRAHACMMFTAYFIFLHFFLTLADFCGSESEPLPTADAIEHCVAYRAVEDAVCKRNLVLITCLLFPFFFLCPSLLCFWVSHIFWYRPFPPVSTVFSQFYVTLISSFLSNTSSCCWNAVFMSRTLCMRQSLYM